MFISSRVHGALLRAGVQFVDHGSGGVDLLFEDAAADTLVSVQVKTWSRGPGPAAIQNLESKFSRGSLLLIAPSFSNSARDEIERHGWSWIILPDVGAVRGELRLPGRSPVVVGAERSSDADGTARVAARGRRPWQRFAIIRHLLLGQTWTQASLMEVCRVTQPRVSQVLKGLLADGLVARVSSTAEGSARWYVSDYGRLFDHWLSEYPGPGGAAPTYWYGLNQLDEQVMAAMALLERERPTRWDPPSPVASGDAAADFIAPYRRSQLAVLYSPWGADLRRAGLTPAPEEAASLKLVVPTDPSVWPHLMDDRSKELAPNAPFPLADPMQVAWDLQESGRVDADQAVRAVRRVLGELRARDQMA